MSPPWNGKGLLLFQLGRGAVYILLLGPSAAGEGRDAAGVALSEENRQGCAKRPRQILGLPHCARKQHMKFHVPALRFLNTDGMNRSQWIFI